ncbi:MAG: transcriptional regulator [Candidatus Margulisiibacteriota bacterium]|nr:MAG: transcriptional regulator [Candidatus Margulisiibacteriota bacterium]
MNKEEISKLLLLGENQIVEFKEMCKPDAIGRIVCSFLNSGGGYVICGIKNGGVPIGIKNAIQVRLELEKDLITKIIPKAIVYLEVQEIQGLDVVIVEVPGGKDIPYAYNNSIYIREGEKTLKASVNIIKDMIMRRQVEPERWERRFSNADIEVDIDSDELHTTVDATFETRLIVFRDPENLVMVLEDLAVFKYGRLTNAGDVLFTKNPSSRYPQVRVRAARYKTDKTDNAYQDMKSFEGPLGEVLEQVYTFIIRNTPTVSRFARSSLVRQDDSLYPEDAVREGLVNAFAHRDYSDFSGGVSVNIYPDRLEIWNSGSFPDGITPETMASGHISILRNPDIAHILYLRGMMEKLGRGSMLIRKACDDRQLLAPQWTSDKYKGVTLTLFAAEVTTEVTTEVKSVIKAVDGELSRHDLQQKLGLKHDEHFRKAYLLPSLEAGCIEMTIPDKPNSRLQKYRLTAKGKQIRKILGKEDQL